MEITPEALKEFKIIYEEYYKISITDTEALEMAKRVLDFFSIVARPLPKEWIESSEICSRVARNILEHSNLFK